MALTDKLKTWNKPPAAAPAVTPAETPPAAATPAAAQPTATTPAAPVSAPPASAPTPAGRLNPLGGWVHPLMQIMSAIKSSPDPSLQDAAQEGKDLSRSFANWGTANWADPAMAKIGQIEPPGTPSWLRFNPDVDAQRKETADARQRLGWLDTFIAKPRGLYAATRLGGSQLEAAAPFAAPIAEMFGYGAASSAGGGERDPLKVGWEGVKSAAEAAPFSLASKYVVGPLTKKFGEWKYGADTPESIAANAQQQAQDLKEKLSNIPVSKEDLGFSYTKGPLANTPNPTYADLQSELENMKNIPPENDPADVGGFLRDRIAKSTATPEITAAQTAADQAASRATTAQQLADWNAQAKFKGMDVPGQATDYAKAQWPNLSQDQRDAYERIANSATEGGSSLMGAMLGGQVGKLAEQGAGFFGVPAPLVREGMTYLGTKLGQGGGGPAAIQQAVLQGYPSLVPGAMPGALQSQLMSDQARQAMNQFTGLGQGFY